MTETTSRQFRLLPDPHLQAAMRASGVTRWGIVKAVAWGTAALGSAIGLAAVAAWMIARAAQLPSPADLALAAVAVRFFGIGRGLFRYLERLASHDAALRGMVNLRERLYDALASSRASTVLSLRRGDIVARAGADLDAVGDALVRSLIPVAVAVTVSAISVLVVGWNLPVAGAALALAILLAAVVPALLTARSARIAGHEGVIAGADVAAAAHAAVEAAAEHRVWDDEGAVRADIARANRAFERAQDRAARPASFAAASQSLFAGVGLIACLALAVAGAASGSITSTSAAVVALVPLAAFEAVGAIPAAIMQYFRSAAAAERLAAIVDEPLDAVAEPTSAELDADNPREPASGMLTLAKLSVGWPAATPTRAVTAALTPGEVLAVTGRSGVGKTTLLLTVGGALAPVAGSVEYGNTVITEGGAGTTYALTLEDAHVFGTSVLENLRVARGDATADDAWAALEVVGLATWVRGLPQGLDTLLGSGGHSVSGGERRRLLMARLLLTTAPLQLIDEPGEHLDPAGIDALRAVLAAMRVQGRSVVVVTHDDRVMAMADEVVSLDD